MIKAQIETLREPNLPDSRAGALTLLNPFEERRVFLWLRWRLAVNLIRQTVRESRLRLILVFALSTLFWWGLFWLFVDGFHFLTAAIPHGGTRIKTVSAISNLFFLSLLTMLIFSSGIILYGGLFRAQETQFLLTLPARAQRVFTHKFHEALLFSSWGFLLLGTPLLIAYGLVANAPWYYFAMLLPFMLAFIHIPCSLGAIACLCIVRWIPGRRWLSLLAAAIVLVALALAVFSGLRGMLLTPSWFHDLLGRLQFSEQRMSPSWWLTTGLINAADGELAESVLFLTLLIANALFFHQLAIWTSMALMWRAFHASRAAGGQRQGWNMSWIDRVVGGAAFFLPRTMRLLITNDFRLFRRDPVQWTQFLIFFGLLGLYFANIRRLSYDLNHATWVNMVSFLNLTVVGLILSTFTSRFVFPMISLEGRRFWILGRLPIERRTVLWSKFLFAALGSIIPCASLVLLSDLMLGVIPTIILLHALTCAMLCIGLSALAVGMGAKMPNLREDSPSKIAAGFGGTLNLVVSTIYIVAVVLMTALPCHFYLGAMQADPGGVLFEQGRMIQWILLGLGTSALLCVAATVIPLWIGIRAFDRLEF